MIKQQNGNFVDEFGRILTLRGVNLSGSSKVPYSPDGASWKKDGFYQHRGVSFIGRPFPLSEADEHFRRLKAWGFTFLRYLVTWEAIEHAGPGIYDEEFLDYTRQIIAKAAEYGISVFIDPHQDVWSRFTGGDGAPGWTLEAAGMDITQLHQAGAAFIHQENGDPYPKMIWPTNYSKLATATMFTLFFAGNDFAPKCRVDGIPIQNFLQNQYIGAILRLADRVKDLSNVVGYDTLNEPSSGFIGQTDLHTRTINPMKLGAMPTLYQSMQLASGTPQEVDFYKIGLAGFVKTGRKTINSEGKSIWLPGYEDIWKQHGVWDIGLDGKPVLLQPDYFSHVGAHPVDFNEDYFKPFVQRYTEKIRAIDPDAMIFIEEIPDEANLVWTDGDPDRIVHAAHWYDNMTLVKKSFVPWFSVDVRSMKIILGRSNVRKNFASQIADLKRNAVAKMNKAPLLIGEVGIPFDLYQEKAYKTGDESDQINALDATMQALESNFASFTLWNYTADNTNERGDQWNDEDLSLFSRDQMKGSDDIYNGGRALKAAIRPYPQKIAGEPIEMSFDITSNRFHLSYRHMPGIKEPTQVFIPQYQYPAGCKVVLSDGHYELNMEAQLLLHWPSKEGMIHSITVTPKQV